MTKNEGIDKVVERLSLRAHVIADEGHEQLAIMKSAFTDFKSLGSVSGLMSVVSTGKLTPTQLELAQRIAIKVIAVLGMVEASKASSATATLAEKESSL